MHSEYKRTILKILAKRDPGKTMCPSEVLSAPDKKNKLLMKNVRLAAITLAQSGKIEIVQRGKPIDLLNFKGPIRLRLPRGST